jgi:hypothetical protein
MESNNIHIQRQTNAASITIITKMMMMMTASVVLQPEFLAADPEVPGSIPGAIRCIE